MKQTISVRIAGVACLAFVATAEAKTLYVDQNSSFIINPDPAVLGDDCTKKNPCGSIIDALSEARSRDRIIVFPGWYEGHHLIDQDNLKLESVTGPRHTFIAGNDASILEVTGNNVTIGKKGKGFAIWKEDESTTNGTTAISVNADKVRIEGNYIWPIDFVYGSGGTSAAISVFGNSAMIRNNWIEASLEGIVISGPGKAKHIISDNEMWRMQGDCIRIESFGGGAAKINNNNLNACRDVEGQSRQGDAHGMRVDFFGIDGKATISDNVVQRTPIGYSVSGGAHNLQRNQHSFGRTGFIFNSSDKPQLKDSATNFLEEAIFLNSDVTDATISGNYFNANMILTHNRTDTTSIKSFTNNEVSRRTTGGAQCAIYTAGSDYTADPIDFNKNHWGAFAPAMGSAAPDLAGDGACSGSNADTAESTGGITFNATFNTAKFKYKDRTRF